MKYVEVLILFLTITSTLFLIIGLFRPWAMLWWEDMQNRSKIIKVYGSLAVIFGLTYYAIKIFYYR